MPGPGGTRPADRSSIAGSQVENPAQLRRAATDPSRTFEHMQPCSTRARLLTLRRWWDDQALSVVYEELTKRKVTSLRWLRPGRPYNVSRRELCTTCRAA